MNLEKLMDEWTEDSRLDTSDLVTETMKTPKLHSKYYRILLEEKGKLARVKGQLKALRLAKREFLVNGPSKESITKGWELPPKGKIMKAEIDQYLDGDSDIIRLTIDVDNQTAIVDFLISAISTINNRQWHIKNLIDYNKFISGVV